MKICRAHADKPCSYNSISMMKLLLFIQLLLSIYFIIVKLKKCAETVSMPPHARKYLCSVLRDLLLFLCVLLCILRIDSIFSGIIFEINFDDESGLVILYALKKILKIPLRYIVFKLVEAISIKTRERFLTILALITFALFHTYIPIYYYQRKEETNAYSQLSLFFLFFGLVLLVIKISNQVTDLLYGYSDRVLIYKSIILRYEMLYYLQVLATLFMMICVLIVTFKHNLTLTDFLEDHEILKITLCFSESFSIGYWWLSRLLFFYFYEYEVSLNEPFLNNKYIKYYYKEQLIIK